jgi:hypothetical protein
MTAGGNVFASFAASDSLASPWQSAQLYDGLSFGYLKAAQWAAASDSSARSPVDNGGTPETSASKLVSLGKGLRYTTGPAQSQHIPRACTVKAVFRFVSAMCLWLAMFSTSAF